MTQPATPPTARQVRVRGPLTWRSVGLGLLGVVLICGLTPYNNYVLNNTDLVGNLLPTGVLLFFVALVLMNALLARVRPGRGLSTGEMVVTLAMMLVGCTLPAGGLMRYLPGNLVAYLQLAGDDANYARVMEAVDLPSWVFPTVPGETIQQQARDPIVRQFLFGTGPADATWTDRLANVPWSAWARPAIAWGVFLAAMYGAVLCLMVIFRRQWVENERLPFPIASVYASLVEAPAPGRILNPLFGSRLFWIAAGGVFTVHLFGGLSQYQPLWPAIPLQYDLTSLLADPPLASMDEWFKKQTIYFTVIGATFFVQTRVAFSIWFFFVLLQVARVMYADFSYEITDGMQQDQFFGAFLPYCAMVLWVARHHLRAVVGQMFRGYRTGEPRGRYLPYALAGWGFVGCLVVMGGWLVAVGLPFVAAVVIVLGMMLAFLVLARIVAETGLLYVLLPVGLVRPWVYLLQEMPTGLAVRASTQTYFLSTMFSWVFLHDMRQALPPYASHAMRVADDVYDQPGTTQRPWLLIVVMVVALAVGFVVSGAATLYIEYNHAVTLDRSQSNPINTWGTQHMPQYVILEPSTRFLPPGEGPIENHSRLGHFAFGAAASTLMSVMRLRMEAWPLHPLGLLLCYTLGVKWVWFSIFLGWLTKSLIIQYGGSGLYNASRDFFIGLILGETLAAAFWLVVAVVLAALGMEFHALQLTLT